MKQKKESQMPLPCMLPAEEPVAVETEDRLPIAQRLHAATRPDMVQIAPGKFVPYRKGQKPPSVSLCKWAPNEDGTYSPIVYTERLVRMTSEVAQLLGVESYRWHTLRRLADVGMVELIKITPGCMMLNLDSWFNHLRLCVEKPWIWNPGSKYYKAYISGLRRKKS